MKKAAICFVLIVSLFLLACTSPDTNSKLEKDLYRGTEGVSLTILEKGVPSEVFEGEEISLVAKLENKGVYESASPIMLVSLEKGYMEFKSGNHISRQAISKLEGKTIFNTFNDFQIAEFPIKVKTINDQSEYHDATILVNMCYDYYGKAFADICIDKDPHSVGSQKSVCTVSDIDLSGGQGGPVAITKIESRMMVDENSIRPQFRIYISNAGQGNVIRYGTKDSVCSNSGLVQGDYNTVDLVDITFSNFHISDFECNPLPLILQKNEDYVTCTLKAGKISKNVGASYLTPIKVEFKYGYIESASKQIKIKKILKY
jgi:hypothetical protein